MAGRSVRAIPKLKQPMNGENYVRSRYFFFSTNGKSQLAWYDMQKEIRSYLNRINKRNYLRADIPLAIWISMRSGI